MLNCVHSWAVNINEISPFLDFSPLFQLCFPNVSVKRDIFVFGVYSACKSQRQTSRIRPWLGNKKYVLAQQILLQHEMKVINVDGVMNVQQLRRASES